MASILLRIFFFLPLLCTTNAFVNAPGFVAKRPQTTYRVRDFHLSMIDSSMLVGAFDSMLEQDLLSDAISTLLPPDIEAEVLTDMSHVLDLSGIFSPSKSRLRLFSIVGRIFTIYADYLPDHTIHPEELAVQLFLLGVSMREIVKYARVVMIMSNHREQKQERRS
jgi:hypothetical protein